MRILASQASERCLRPAAATLLQCDCCSSTYVAAMYCNVGPRRYSQAWKAHPRLEPKLEAALSLSGNLLLDWITLLAFGPTVLPKLKRIILVHKNWVEAILINIWDFHFLASKFSWMRKSTSEFPPDYASSDVCGFLKKIAGNWLKTNQGLILLILLLLSDFTLGQRNSQGFHDDSLDTSI